MFLSSIFHIKYIAAKQPNCQIFSLILFPLKIFSLQPMKSLKPRKGVVMKITNNNFRINKLYQQIRKPERLQKNSVEKKSEAVILSADAGKIAEAVKLVMQMDDVRLERVQELQAKMKAGNYRVDPEELAEAMLSQDK